MLSPAGLPALSPKGRVPPGARWGQAQRGFPSSSLATFGLGILHSTRCKAITASDDLGLGGLSFVHSYVMYELSVRAAA